MLTSDGAILRIIRRIRKVKFDFILLRVVFVIILATNASNHSLVSVELQDLFKKSDKSYC